MIAVTEPPLWLLDLDVAARDQKSKVAAVPVGDGPRYDDLRPEYRAEADRRRLAAMDRAASALADLGPHDLWDQGTFEACCDLARVLAAPWASPDSAAAASAGLALVLKHGPRDAGFTERELRSKWESAMRQVRQDGVAAWLPSAFGGAVPVNPDGSRLGSTPPAAPADRRPPEPTTVDDEYERAVEAETQTLRIREAARARLVAERAARFPRPPVVGLGAFLDEPDDDPEYRIDRLWPTGGNILLAGSAKAGKSHLVQNVIRSLADGDPFLDEFHTEPANVVVLDDEVDPRQWRRWLREQQIVNVDRVRLVSLKGRVGSFNIIDPDTRAGWADDLRWADVIVFDCLRPVLDALGLSEDKDAGQFTTAFDALKVEAGISEGLLVHHMGHDGKHARGDSSLLGWPTAIWNLARDADDMRATRYLDAVGRDVDHPQQAIVYDEATRRMTLGEGNRKQVAAYEVIPAVLAVLREQSEPLSFRALRDAVMERGHKEDPAREAINTAEHRGLIEWEKGARGAHLYRLAAPTSFEQS